ncbi:MAG: cobalamin-binding protein [Marivirga sp.]|nr:cobalamin-binding protein [Marivirga sp.]
MAVRSFFDQMGYEVPVSYPPRRIISLVPSQTELLFDLGLQQEVLGITKFCIHPSGWLKEKTIIGGTKNFNADAIDRLQPDLIIGNKEENYREGIEKLKTRFPVWMSDIATLQDALAMITSVGELTGKVDQAHDLRERIVLAFSTIKRKTSQSVLYLIWRKPWMAAGKDTFIDSMLTTIGLKNVVATPRYPQLSSAEIQKLKPDLIFLSTEPYPFKDDHILELKEISKAQTTIVDGEMFSWYGSRLLKAPGYFNQLL